MAGPLDELMGSVRPMTDQIMANRQKPVLEKLMEGLGYQNGQWHAPGVADALSYGAMALPMGRAMPAAARSIQYHRSPNDFGAFDISKSKTGNSFGDAVYFAPEPQPGFGAKTYEAALGGKPLRIDVGDPASVAQFNKQFGTSLQEGGYFAREADQQALPDILKGAGYDRLEVAKGNKLLETAVYNPGVIELLRKYGLIGMLGGAGYQSGRTQ